MLYVTAHTDWVLDGHPLLEGEAFLAKAVHPDGLQAAVAALLAPRLT